MGSRRLGPSSDRESLLAASTCLAAHDAGPRFRARAWLEAGRLHHALSGSVDGVLSDRTDGIGKPEALKCVIDGG